MGRRKIFISHIRQSVDVNDQMELFGKYGPVHHADVWTDELSQLRKTFGVVEMVSERDAKRAIRSLEGRVWHGWKLKLGTSRSIFRRCND
jgi:U2-associated protein SR140